MRKYLLGFFALALGLGLSAFTVSAPKMTGAEYFTYLGDVNGGGTGNVDNYEYKATQSRSCFGSSPLCEILTMPENPGDPVEDHVPILAGATQYFHN